MKKLTETTFADGSLELDSPKIAGEVNEEMKIYDQEERQKHN